MLREREFKTLIETIQKSERVRLRVETGYSQQTLTLRTPYGDKVLQFKVISDDKLVIQHMAFQKQRTGIGTIVLELLKAYSLKNNLFDIGIENGNSPSIVAFAKKHGFEEVKGEVYIKEDGIFYGNYLLSLTDREV